MNVFAQLSGNIVIGSKRAIPFNSLNAAFDEMKAVGVEGSVCFLLEDDQYETEPIELSDIQGINPSTVIKIKPASGANPLIVLTSGTDLLTFSTIGRFFIDGRYEEQDTAHHISFKAENIITLNTIETKLQEDRMSFSIRNCNLIAGGSGSYGIFHQDIRVLKNCTFINPDTVVCTNNNFYNFSQSIFSQTFNFVCDSNKFYNSGNEEIEPEAIYISIFSNKLKGKILVRNNIFNDCIVPFKINAAQSDIDMVCNKIICSRNSEFGVQIWGATTVNFTNNIITGPVSVGLQVFDQVSATIAYNTIRIKPTTASSYSDYLASCLFMHFPLYDQIVENNIFELDESNIANISPVYVFSGASSCPGCYTCGGPRMLIESGNCFNHVTSQAYFGFCSLELYKTYSDWVKSINKTNATSVDKANSFVSSTDLHLTAPNHQGIPIPEITTDIEGNPRDPLHPDAGAYEYVQIAANPIVAQVGQCQGNAIQFSVSGLPTGSWSVLWNFGDGQTGSGLQTQHFFTNSGLFNVTASVVGAQNYSLNKSVQVSAIPAKPSVNIKLQMAQ